MRESEIKARIKKATGTFAALKNIWKTNKISKQNKDPPVQEQRPQCATICGGIMEGHQRHMPDAGSFFKTSASGRYCESTGQTKSPTRNSTTEQVCSPTLSRLNAAYGNGSDTSAECR